MTVKKVPHPPEPWLPVSFSKSEAYAFKALANGEANGEQQRRVLEWLLQVAGGYDDMSFRPGGLDGDRATAFAEGRRFVASQVWKLINIRSDVLEKMRDAV